MYAEWMDEFDLIVTKEDIQQYVESLKEKRKGKLKKILKNIFREER